MPRSSRKTRKIRKQKGGGTQQVNVNVYSDSNHENRINIINLSEKRINSIVLAAQDYLNDHFRERNSPNQYIGSFSQIDDHIRIHYGIVEGDTVFDIKKKNFPPGAIQKILRTNLTVVVLDNDVFYLKFAL